MTSTKKKTIMALALLVTSFSAVSASTPNNPDAPLTFTSNNYPDFYFDPANDLGLAVEITILSESNGKHFTTNKKTGETEPLTSPAGAIGIMQLLPDTAKWIAEKNEITWDTDAVKALLNNPEFNIKLGTLYLSYTIHRYGDNLSKGLAAYNAGPGTLDKAIKKHGEDWLTHMPAETKKYVKTGTEVFLHVKMGLPLPTEYVKKYGRLDAATIAAQAQQKLAANLP